MSRLRLIETGKFHSCWDRNLSRMRNITVFETDQDWANDVKTETLLRVSLISATRQATRYQSGPIGLLSRSLWAICYFHNLHIFSVLKTRTGARRKDSGRISRRKMLWKVSSRNMENEETEMKTCFSGKTRIALQDMAVDTKFSREVGHV